jgi:hypothetical protein
MDESNDKTKMKEKLFAITKKDILINGETTVM